MLNEVVSFPQESSALDRWPWPSISLFTVSMEYQVCCPQTAPHQSPSPICSPIASTVWEDPMVQSSHSDFQPDLRLSNPHTPCTEGSFVSILDLLLTSRHMIAARKTIRHTAVSPDVEKVAVACGCLCRPIRPSYGSSPD